MEFWRRIIERPAAAVGYLVAYVCLATAAVMFVGPWVLLVFTPLFATVVARNLNDDE